MSQPIKTACVLGGGSAGFLSAIALRKLLPSVGVTLVHSKDIPVIGVGESTTGYFPHFLHNRLQLDRSRFFREVDPVWKLGIKFIWGPPDRTHFNYSFEKQMMLCLPGWDKHAAYHCMEEPSDGVTYSALMDRNLSPLFRANGKLHLKDGAAYHIDNRKFLAHLETVAHESGVVVIDGRMDHLNQSNDGTISSIHLSSGQSIAADLFIDCSGFSQLLIGEKGMGERFHSYRDALLCDRALVGSWKNRNGEIQPYTTAETMDNGWCWRIDFIDHVNRGYVFSSEFCSVEEAAKELRENNPRLPDDLTLIKFPSGRVDNFWTGNVVGVGNSAAFVEPLESTALHMAGESVEVLCGLLQETGLRIIPEVSEVYNRTFRRKWDDIRNFLSLHYKFNSRRDTPFWRHCREHVALGGTGDIVNLFRAAGPSTACGDFIPVQSIFGIDGYLTMLIGQRVETTFPNILTDSDRTRWKQWCRKVGESAGKALPVRDALRLVNSSDWTWQGR